MPLLDDRTGVVTGGASGIGRHIALEFAREGADVVVADVREDPREGGEPTHERIARETDADALHVECDVAETADLEAAVTAAEEFGGIDVMVNNAAIATREPFLETTEDQFAEHVAVNLKGVFFGSQVAAERMDDGSIINISSIGGLRGGPGPLYSMSKGGVRLLTYSLATVLAPEIRANVIHPGPIETRMSLGSSLTEETREFFETQIPRGRIGHPTDIGEAAAFLASERADFITGQSIVVDGGLITSNRDVGTGEGIDITDLP